MDQALGQRIRRARGDLSQRELAAAASIEATALNKIEAGRRRVALDELIRIARVLGVPAHALMEDETTAFAMRADGASEDVLAAQRECSRLIDGFLQLKALAGRR